MYWDAPTARMGIPWVSFSLLVSPLRHIEEHPQTGSSVQFISLRDLLFVEFREGFTKKTMRKSVVIHQTGGRTFHITWSSLK